jgi:hypothetical protein
MTAKPVGSHDAMTPRPKSSPREVQDVVAYAGTANGGAEAENVAAAQEATVAVLMVWQQGWSQVGRGSRLLEPKACPVQVLEQW